MENENFENSLKGKKKQGRDIKALFFNEFFKAGKEGREIPDLEEMRKILEQAGLSDTKAFARLNEHYYNYKSRWREILHWCERLR